MNLATTLVGLAGAAVLAVAPFSLPVGDGGPIAPPGAGASAPPSNGHTEQRHHRDRTLVHRLRRATARLHDIATAESAGYGLFKDVHGIACIAQPGMGGMGVHYVNGDLVKDPAIDPDTPEAMVYAPDRDGTLRLAALEFIVDKSAWDATHAAPPELFHGRRFDLTRAPNRFGLASFYSQHVWVWKPNSAGLQAMWNPAVHCQ